MLVIECKGTPYEIGHTHGAAARKQIYGSITFYSALFLKNTKKTWPEVQSFAFEFEQHSREAWPRYHEEMCGIADGAGVDLLDIVALNVRTEINFGLFSDNEKEQDDKNFASDGCTSLAWGTAKSAYLGQNWDWMTAQKPNLIITKIHQEGRPTIAQVTEAGIIGKIGFNSSGVGTLLNAIRVQGMDPAQMPVHFGLRLALESSSAQEAVQRLESYGMASSAHILVADENDAVGLEFTKSTFARCLPDARGRVVHTNHFLLPHKGEIDTIWLKDSLTRVKTMMENSGKLGAEPSWGEMSKLFEDEHNLPTAICRFEDEVSGSATLFSILMDLKAKKGVVRMGRPTEAEETINLEL
ncbi:peptidase C45 acyl-coenzyme A:6-aminopenicillanic acid acyl-transferas-like protein [Amniculicola lignicola CBS 123094]|uniref:Peptidase C45 acyl-coenzyme A:6-aminopenicillanic acid acyl-transferas-like protein n=1 Tax=Amniculicola lignicola CBS 123094 TaxID=1392246 RepID=A0A6A5W3J1_9PLEO|nr:peptidase C45 acyl-coenzyme A:6-aminopenicillanic acid acyl-transferas-like protein [Amniculicola lignicola CBS 123094]